MRRFTKYPQDYVKANSDIFAMSKRVDNIGVGAAYWICDYVMYSLYLADPAKFTFSNGGESYKGGRKTGDTSGYDIDLQYNNHNIPYKVSFSITSTGSNTVYVQGGEGASHVETDMNANAAIQYILTY